MYGGVCTDFSEFDVNDKGRSLAITFVEREFLKGNCARRNDVGHGSYK